MATFEEILKEKLNKTVTAKNGQEITPMEAMVNAIMNNAMKGDIASITFIQNLTRVIDTEEEENNKAAKEARHGYYFEKLKDQLKAEKLYDGQDAELDMLTDKYLFVMDLDTQIMRVDFQPVITDPKTGKQTVSPLIQLRDTQRELFDKQLAKLRHDAISRKMMAKNAR